MRFSGLSAGTEWLLANGEKLSTVFPQLHPKRNKLDTLAPRSNLDLKQFTELLQVRQHLVPLGVLGCTDSRGARSAAGGA